MAKVHIHLLITAQQILHPTVPALPGVHEYRQHAAVNAGGIEVLQHSHDILALAFRPDGKQIATATLDGQIHFWDPQEGELQARSSHPHLQPLSVLPHVLSSIAKLRDV